MIRLPHNIYAFLENASEVMASGKPGIVSFYVSPQTKENSLTMLGENYPLPPVAKRPNVLRIIVQITQEHIDKWQNEEMKALVLAELLIAAASSAYNPRVRKIR